MALAILDPLRDILRTSLRDVGNRAKAGLVIATLLTLAAGLLLSAGLVALSREVGYPVAAIVFAVILALVALAVHLVERDRATRQAQRVSHARSKVAADIVLATSVARSAVPLLPVIAFVAAFAFMRRR